MANRYWVGGTGLWNATSTTNWSAASGGAGGASAPTSTDNVFLDANSGSGRVVYDGAFCQNIDCTGFIGTLESGGPANGLGITIHGSIIFSAGMTVLTGAGFTLKGAGVNYILSNGKTVDDLYLETTGTYIQSDALLTNLIINKGTFLTNNYTLSGSVFSNSTELSVLNFGSSTVAASINFQSAGNFNFLAGTSILTTDSISVGAVARTFYNWSPAASAITVGNITFNNVTLSGNLTLGGNVTVVGVLTLPTGASVSSPITWSSDSIGTQRTLTVNSISGTPTYYFFSDIAFSGSSAPLTGTYFGNLGNNSGITFPSSVAYYWVAGSGTWGVTTAWATSSGGTAVASVFPLPQDSVIFDDNSGGSGTTITAQTGSVYLTSITATARTLPMTLTMANGSGGRRIYAQGNVLFSSACSLAADSSISISEIFIAFNGRTVQDLDFSGATSLIPIAIRNTGGSVRLLSNLNITRSGTNFSPPVLHEWGTLNTNGYNITCVGSYNVSPTNYAFSLKTIIIGTTTLTASRWSALGSVVITGAGVIKITGTTFSGGVGNYYPTVDCFAASITFSGSSRFADITNSYKTTGASTIRFTANTVTTFDNFNLAGEATRICTLTSTTTISRAALVLSSGVAIDMGSTSTNGANNSGITFTGSGAVGYLAVSYINGLASNGGFFLM